MLDAVSGTTAGPEHGSTLASSVVAEEGAGRGGTTAGPEHGSTLASSVVAEIRGVISAAVATNNAVQYRPLRPARNRWAEPSVVVCALSP